MKKRVKHFFDDFKKFISKGNILDLAVAVVIGAAFTKIVNSLVADIVMPLIGIIVGQNNIAEQKWQITATLSLNWGLFIMAIIDFLLIAFFVFLIIRIINRTGKGLSKISKKARKELSALTGKTDETVVDDTLVEEVQEEAPVPPETMEDILRDIRALLLAQQEQGKKDSED